MTSDGAGRYRIGCDVGGTFTDFIVQDNQTGAIHHHKVLTTPNDPSEAVLTGIRELGERLDGWDGGVAHVVHGTTLAVNAVIERKGANTALLTTTGFRDILELRRHLRSDVYDIRGSHVAPLVPRHLRLEVTERIYTDGRVLQPLDEDALRSLCRRLADEGVTSVAVSFLHAYAHPQHERLAGTIVRDELPGVSLSLSHEVHPEVKEFERTSTTVANAYVKPIIEGYVDRLAEGIAPIEGGPALVMMHSGGGLIDRGMARELPVRVMESGPVGGVLQSQHVGARTALEAFVAFDMGGTTAKGCYLADDELPITMEFEVDRALRFRAGSGLPVAVPTVDLVEVGAGGGSIASVLDGELLQVGPESAGASPGPACYRQGGEQPTVTDADLVTGYLNPGNFLGGRMQLDVEAAEAAIARHVAEPLGISTDRAAWGVHELVNEEMAAALRGHLAEHGVEGHDIALVAYGGAGPVHAFGVARKLGIKRMVVPRNAGVGSARGFLLAPPSYQVVRSLRRRVDDVETAVFADGFDAMRVEARAVLDRMRDGDDQPVDERLTIDLSYWGQDSGIEVDFPVDDDGNPVDGCQKILHDRFLEAYRERLGQAYDDVPVGVLRLRYRAELADSTDRSSDEQVVAPVDAEVVVGNRRCPDPTSGDHVDFAVLVRDRLAPGERHEGPLIVEDDDTTVVVGTDAVLSVADEGDLIIDMAT